jgi:hypothetical protein
MKLEHVGFAICSEPEHLLTNMALAVVPSPVFGLTVPTSACSWNMWGVPHFQNFAKVLYNNSIVSMF